jgi:hypothetical protein
MSYSFTKQNIKKNISIIISVETCGLHEEKEICNKVVDKFIVAIEWMNTYEG